MALIHTCYRITDIDRSVAFYEALGFQEVARLPIGDEAVNVFMNQPGDGDMPRLELTYNFGVDSYEIGTGYGHIAITTDDLDGMLARLAGQGIEPEKPPYTVTEGGPWWRRRKNSHPAASQIHHVASTPTASCSTIASTSTVASDTPITKPAADPTRASRERRRLRGRRCSSRPGPGRSAISASSWP